jgi:hypothetical protein
MPQPGNCEVNAEDLERIQSGAADSSLTSSSAIPSRWANSGMEQAEPGSGG